MKATRILTANMEAAKVKVRRCIGQHTQDKTEQKRLGSALIDRARHLSRSHAPAWECIHNPMNWGTTKRLFTALKLQVT